MQRQLRFAPYVAFVLSGASSLIFQTIWSRMLHHVFGATSVAISTVLTVFMAGLGLGTWFAGRYAARIKHPIYTYAIAEVGVAIFSLFIPFLVASDGWLAEVNAWLHQNLGDNVVMLMMVRFLCVAPILLVPTFLMGSSLPLLSQHFARTEKDPGEVSAKVGMLYAVNTIGAACGPFLSAFVMMPTFGLMATNVFAVCLNLLLAALIVAFRPLLIGSTWKSGVPIEPWPGKDVIEDSPIAPPPDASPEDPTTDDESPRKKTKKAKRAAAKQAAKVAAPAADTPWVPQAARIMAVVAFGLSGAAAMAYEVVWTRALAMTIGSSIYSFAVILMTFLVGIASGSATMSTFLGRGRTPLVGVGVTACVLTMLAMTPWGLDIRTTGGGEHHGDVLVYVLCCVFPVLLVVFAGVYAARMAARTESLARAGGVTHDGADALLLPGLVMLLVPLTCAVLNAGYFGGGYLPKIIASVVACVVVFLGLAMALRRHPVLLLALVQFFIAVATIVSYVWQDEIPYAFAQLVVSIDDLPDHVGLVQFFMFVTSSLCTLPSTLGMGAMFPLTMRVWTAGGANIGRDVAVVYTSNTVGSILGAWLPGFVLFAAFGAERTLIIGIGLNLVLALGMLIAGAAEPEEPKPAEAEPAAGDGEDPPAKATKPERARRGELPTWHAAIVYTLSPLIPALIALLYVVAWRENGAMRWNQTQMTLGVFRVSLAEGMLDPESWGQPDLVFYEDGLSTTVSVERWHRHYALKNNGKVDASNGDDMPTQVSVATYPLLLHQDGPTDLDVAVIGFGSGVSVGTALSFPVRTVDVIELERAIPDAARFFEDVNLLDYSVDGWPHVEMERLRIINDDGRNYLAATDREYDVIISEPSNPWIAGVSDLFTTDHFRITKRRLRPGGIYCQWVQLYELSPENIKTIYRTFAQEYRYVVVLAADDRSSDTVMLGSDAPITLDLERMRRVWELEAVQDHDPEGGARTRMSVADQLARANLSAPFDLYARVLLASREEVLSYAQIERRRRGGVWHTDFMSTNRGPCAAPDCERVPAVLNTDDNARIEFAAPRDLIGFQRYEGYLGTIYSHEWPYGRLDDHLRGFGEGDERARNLAELALSLTAHGRYDLAATYIEQSQRAGRARETAVALEVLTHLLSAEHEPRVRVEAPAPGPELERAQAVRLLRGFEHVREAIDRGEYGAALVAMEEIEAPLRRHSGPQMRFLYGYLLYKGADGSLAQYRAAADQLEDLLRTDVEYVDSHPETYYFLARALDEEGSYPEATTYMRAYVEQRLTSTGGDDAAVAEPPAGQAPTSDAPGESDKTRHGEHT